MAGWLSQSVLSGEEEVSIIKRRRIYSLPVVGLLLSGLLVSGLLDVLPAFLRFSTVVLLFSGLAGAASRTIGLGSGPALTFLAGFSLLSIFTWAFWLLNASFAAYTAALSIVLPLFYAGAVVWQFVAPREGTERVPPGESREGRLVLVLAALTGLSFLIVPPVFQSEADTYDHMGYIRAIAWEDRVVPDGVLAADGITREPGDTSGVQAPPVDPRKGTFHPLMAAVCRLAGVEPGTAWRWLPVWLAPVLVLSYYRFLVVLLPPGAARWVALVLFMMFAGGFGRGFLGNAAYGQNLALAYFWTVVGTVLAPRFRPAAGPIAGVALIVAGGALIHVGAAVHVGLALVSITVFAKWFGWSFRHALRVAVPVALVTVVVAVWKMMSVSGEPNWMHTHPQGLLYLFDFGASHYVPSPVEILRKQGLLFLVGIGLVAVLPVLRRHRLHARRMLALSLPPMLLALNPFTVPLLYERVTYLVHRMLVNIPAFAISALVVVTLVSWGRSKTWPGRALAVVALFLWARPFLVSTVAWWHQMQGVPAVRSASSLPPGIPTVSRFLRESAPPGSVVVSDPVSSYAISAVNDVRVVALLHQHGNPYDPMPFERLDAARAVVSPFRAQADAVAALRRYGVSYVVLNGAYPGPLRAYLANWNPQWVDVVTQKLEGIGGVELVHRAGKVLVYRVEDPVVDGAGWFPAWPLSDEWPDVDPCADTGQPLMITGMRTDPPAVVAGETARLTVAYSRTDNPSSPLPLELQVRFDDATYFADASRFPGDKLVRRFRERRTGRFHRWRLDHAPFDGLWPAMRWPVGRELHEQLSVAVPAAAAASVYDVGVRLVHKPLIPNFAVRDFLFNDDSYTGTVCGQLRVSYQVRR